MTPLLVVTRNDLIPSLAFYALQTDTKCLP